jgi:subtilisin family serine protease
MKYRNVAMIGMMAGTLAACGGSGGGDDDDGHTSGGDTAPPKLAYTQTHLEQINAIGSRMMGVGGADSAIAVFDTGIDGSHAEFGGRAVAGNDSLADDGDRTYKGAALTDEGSHGTSVASMAAGENVGVAPDANVASYKVLGRFGTGGSAQNLLDGLTAAANANTRYVLNFSINAPIYPSRPSTPVGQMRDIIVNGINNQDWVVVAAAGNTSGNTTAGPASADEAVFGGQVLVVGAVNANNQLADFSASATTNSELAGDAGDILGVVEHFIVAPGAGVCTALTTSKVQGSCTGSMADSLSASYSTASGTSFATPLVSGAVAVIRSAYPSLTGKQVVEVLLDSAKDLGTPGYDATYGAGLLDVGAALTLADSRTQAKAN